MLIILQVSCSIILLLQYIPQIKKLHDTKKNKDISIGMYLFRIISTLISCYTLTLSNNSFIVMTTQYVSLLLSGIVLVQLLMYTKRKHHSTIFCYFSKNNKG